jgi:hypothetical protein
MQSDYAVDALGQPSACQHSTVIVDQLDVVVLFGPVITDEQQRPHLLLGWLHLVQRGGGQPAI